MVKLNSKKGKEIVAEIKQAILNGDIGDIFGSDFDQSEVDWVDFRCTNEKWEAATTQKQFREACQRIIKKLIEDTASAAGRVVTDDAVLHHQPAATNSAG